MIVIILKILAISRKEDMMKRNKLSKEELIRFLEEFKSVGKVASELSLPYSTIHSWYKSYDIGLLPSCMTIYEELRSIGLSDTQRSVIIGSVLGDGSLLKNRNSKNARLQIGHCTKQLGYLKWKKELLDPFVKKITPAEAPGNKVICGKDSYSSGYYFINTIAHPDITRYYDKYYVDGHKRVTEDIIENLDWLSVAILFADDGSFTLRKNNNYSLRCSLATCSFNKKELEILVVALSRFYGGYISIDNYNNTLRLNGGTDNIDEFLNKISSILPECIHYKLAPQRLHVRPL
jgi:hypothetical protein